MNTDQKKFRSGSVCLAPESPTQFSVPGYVTAIMPAGSGTLAVANFTNYSSVTAACAFSRS